jgi:hypothetical protein
MQDGIADQFNPSTFNISTVFQPNAISSNSSHFSPPDTILRSSDFVHFYAHKRTLLEVSDNNFNSLIPDDIPTPNPNTTGTQVIEVPEDAMTLNIMLHLIYGFSCKPFRPNLDLLGKALPALQNYGISVPDLLSDTEILSLLISFAPAHPLEVYALAGQVGLDHVAETASQFTLSTPLSSISEALAAQMGTKYLRLLFNLHISRVEALKEVLRSPPSTHEPTPGCSSADQKQVTRAWGLTAAYLVWDARADMSADTIATRLNVLLDNLQCFRCREKILVRIRAVLQEWAGVKRTI